MKFTKTPVVATIFFATIFPLLEHILGTPVSVGHWIQAVAIFFVFMMAFGWFRRVRQAHKVE